MSHSKIGFPNNYLAYFSSNSLAAIRVQAGPEILGEVTSLSCEKRKFTESREKWFWMEDGRQKLGYTIS